MTKTKYAAAKKEILQLYQYHNPKKTPLKNKRKTPSITTANFYRSFFIKELIKSIVLTFFIISIQFIIYLVVNGKI